MDEWRDELGTRGAINETFVLAKPLPRAITSQPSKHELPKLSTLNTTQCGRKQWAVTPTDGFLTPSNELGMKTKATCVWQAR